jgi:hypothetical protein
MAPGLNYRSVPALPERLGSAQLGAPRRAPGYGRPPGKHRRGSSAHSQPGVGTTTVLGLEGPGISALRAAGDPRPRRPWPRPQFWGVVTCANK